MNTQDLLKIKREIEAAKTTVSELTEEQTLLMRQLKEQHGCNTVDEAEKKLEDLDIEIASMTRNIEKGLAELDEKYSNL